MNGRPFSKTEDDFLRDQYYHLTKAQIATRLGRRKGSIHARARKLGIAARLEFATDAQIVDALKRHHADGFSDTEICSLLKNELGVPVNRHRIGCIRARLGLSDNSRSDRQRSRVAAKTREQLAQSGFETLCELRLWHMNRFKQELGWPEYLSIRAVQAAELLRRNGAMTRVQLCIAMKVDPNERTNPKSNAKGGTVLAELARAGIVTRLKKVVPLNQSNGKRVRHRTDLYFINPEWMNKNDSPKIEHT